MQLHNYMASSITGWKSSFGLGVKVLGKETWPETVQVKNGKEKATLKE